MQLIEAHSKGLYDKIKALYFSAFPKEERKPFWLIKKMQDAGTSQMLAIQTEEGEFAGLALTVLYEDMVLLDYFAIEDHMRGSGVGSEAFKMIKNRYEDKVFFLEIEDTQAECENKEQRMSRKRFYERHGMTSMPYVVDLVGVDMEVLTLGHEIPFERYFEFYEAVFQGRLSKKIRLLTK